MQATYIQEQTEIGPCPKCNKGIIIEGKNSYGCSLWKEGCSLTIWKTQYGKKLSLAQVKALIGKRETGVLTFTNKKQVKYKGKLKMNNEWKIVMEFEKTF